jgi:hypothetical protein
MADIFAAQIEGRCKGVHFVRIFSKFGPKTSSHQKERLTSQADFLTLLAAVTPVTSFSKPI